jgi:hypothetical protein
VSNLQQLRAPLVEVENLAVVFMVEDLGRTHRFYAETLGLTFEVVDLEGGYLQARRLVRRAQGPGRPRPLARPGRRALALSARELT